MLARLHFGGVLPSPAPASHAVQVDEDNLTQHTGSEVEGLDQRAEGARKRKRMRKRAAAAAAGQELAEGDSSEGEDEDEERRAAKRQRREEVRQLMEERMASERRIAQLELERKQEEQRLAREAKAQEVRKKRMEEHRRRQVPASPQHPPVSETMGGGAGKY